MLPNWPLAPQVGRLASCTVEFDLAGEEFLARAEEIHQEEHSGQNIRDIFLSFRKHRLVLLHQVQGLDTAGPDCHAVGNFGLGAGRGFEEPGVGQRRYLQVAGMTVGFPLPLAVLEDVVEAGSGDCQTGSVLAPAVQVCLAGVPFQLACCRNSGLPPAPAAASVSGDHSSDGRGSI